VFVLTVVFMFDLSLWNSETFIEKSYNNRYKNICYYKTRATCHLLWKTDLNGAFVIIFSNPKFGQKFSPSHQMDPNLVKRIES